MLVIYNSLTHKKEPLKLHSEGIVNLYVCGMTVYDFCHLGNARTFLVFDTVVRYLRHIGYKVHYIRNITDIDDKILKRAKEEGVNFHVIANRFNEALHEDLGRLGLIIPDEEPKAIEYIDAMIEIIKGLLDKGYAYQGKNGDIYYDVKKFSDYGKLAHKKLEDLKAGARVDVAEEKHSPLDFVLWKCAKPGEPSWEASWGAGRPGWHIECSAMSLKCLGEFIDIHGGGKDLIFPHHENEIAQSEAFTSHPFATIWMHSGHLQIDQKKMSKSLGNFFTVRDVLKNYDPEVIRYFVLSSHYRSPLNYQKDSLDVAELGLTRLYLALREESCCDSVLNQEAEELKNRFIEAMNDDFNTPQALAILFEIVSLINKLDSKDRKSFMFLLKTLGNVLGILQKNPEEFLKKKIQDLSSTISDEEVEKMVKERSQARAEKNWKRSDELRDELSKYGIILEDKTSDTLWRRK